MTPEAIQKIEALIEEAEHYGNRSMDKNLARLGNEKAIKGRNTRKNELKYGRKSRDESRDKAAISMKKGQTEDALKHAANADTWGGAIKGLQKSKNSSEDIFEARRRR